MIAADGHARAQQLSELYAIVGKACAMSELFALAGKWIRWDGEGASLLHLEVDD